jgi:hypothetical protein
MCQGLDVGWSLLLLRKRAANFVKGINKDLEGASEQPNGNATADLESPPGSSWAL